MNGYKYTWDLPMTLPRIRVGVLTLGFLITGLLMGCATDTSKIPAISNLIDSNNSIAAKQLARHFSELANNKEGSQVYEQKIRPNGIVEFYLEGEPYQGKSTRIFALYKRAENPLRLPSGKSPAVVLVHGGGGSAYDDWVEKWNAAGFTAISIALEGQTDIRLPNLDAATGLKWERHSYPGPYRNGIYADSDKPLADQWMYHAVSAVIRARLFLEQKNDIDVDHIGLSGISWGGVITSTVMGFDTNFDFAIPIYGCGFLDDMENQYQTALVNNDSYRYFWEPGKRIERFASPSLWLTWRDDAHFALDAQAMTYAQLPGQYSVSIKPGIKHSHTRGWNQKESYYFAKQVVTEGGSWVEPGVAEMTEEGLARAEFYFDLPQSEYQILNAKIHYTDSSGHTGNADWTEMPAMVHAGSGKKLGAEISAERDLNGIYTARYDFLPDNVVHWFINLEVEVNSLGSESAESYVVSSSVVTKER